MHLTFLPNMPVIVEGANGEKEFRATEGRIAFPPKTALWQAERLVEQYGDRVLVYHSFDLHGRTQARFFHASDALEFYLEHHQASNEGVK